MSAPPYYPIFLNLRDRPVLIVGGGSVATRKAKSLLAGGARVTVISREFSSELGGLAPLTRTCADYAPHHMSAEKWALVFAATNDMNVNQRIAEDARGAAILCCRCDMPEEGDFLSPSVERVGGIALAVTTGGASPPLARRIRQAAAAAIDPLLAEWVALLEKWRGRVKSQVGDPHVRGQLLQRLAGPEMEEQLRAHGGAAAEQLFERWLNETGAPRVH